jgi:hypothetical protein
MRRRGLAACVVAIAFAASLACATGCGRGQDASAKGAPSSSASSAPSASASKPAPPPPPAFAGTFDGHPLRFAHGLARPLPSGELALLLTTEPLACDAPSEALSSLDRVELHVSPGPDAKFFAGGPIGVETRVAAWKTGAHGLLPPRAVRLEIAPFAAKAGERMRGTLAVDHVERDDVSGATRAFRAEGPFDVTLCPGEYDKLAGDRADAPATALTGKFDKSVFKARSAIAIARRDEATGVDYLAEIIFYDRPDTTCAGHTEWRHKLDFLTLEAISGASSKAPLPPGPQPARAFYWTASKTDVYAKERHPLGDSPTATRAWIKLDALSFEHEAPISGVVVASAPPGTKPEQTGKFEGAFTGIVCRR